MCSGRFPDMAITSLVLESMLLPSVELLARLEAEARVSCFRVSLASHLSFDSLHSLLTPCRARDSESKQVQNGDSRSRSCRRSRLTPTRSRRELIVALATTRLGVYRLQGFHEAAHRACICIQGRQSVPGTRRRNGRRARSPRRLGHAASLSPVLLQSIA